MLRLMTDEHVHGGIVRGMRRKYPEVDIVRCQEVGLMGKGDSFLLDWAATQGRVVISRDRKTMIRYATDRVVAGQTMPGLFILRKGMTVGQIIEELALVALCSSPDEWEGRVGFLPL